jgi:DNA-binding transcriptional MerR regulator
MSSILKIFLMWIGKFIISISLTVFIATSLAQPLTENLDVLEDALIEELDTEILLQEIIESDLSFEEIENICELNPNQEGCDIIKDPSILLEDQLQPLEETIEEIKPAISMAKIFSALGFFLGALLLYLGTLNPVLTLYKISATTLFTSGFYAIFYTFLTRMIPNLAKEASASVGKDLPQSLLNATVNAITAWLQAPVESVVNLCILLVGISLPLTILFFFLKKRYPGGNQPAEAEKPELDKNSSKR